MVTRVGVRISPISDFTAYINPDPKPLRTHMLWFLGPKTKNHIINGVWAILSLRVGDLTLTQHSLAEPVDVCTACSKNNMSRFVPVHDSHHMKHIVPESSVGCTDVFTLNHQPQRTPALANLPRPKHPPKCVKRARPHGNSGLGSSGANGRGPHSPLVIFSLFISFLFAYAHL